jgi:hypothetical protein
MNEKIKELAEQASADLEPEDFMGVSEEFLELFAELIVKECSQLAHNCHPDELPFVGGKILEHFGVE